MDRIPTRKRNWAHWFLRRPRASRNQAEVKDSAAHLLMSFLAGDKSFSPRRTNPWIIMQTFELLVGPLERFFPSLIVECSSLSAGMPYVFHGNFSFAMCLPNKTRDFASRGAQPKRSRPPRFFSSVVRGSSSRRSLINGCPKRVFSFFFSLSKTRWIDRDYNLPRAEGFHHRSTMMPTRFPSRTFLYQLSVDLRSDTIYRFKIVCCKYSLASSLFSWIILNYRNNGKFVSKKWEGRSFVLYWPGFVKEFRMIRIYLRYKDIFIEQCFSSPWCRLTFEMY